MPVGERLPFDAAASLDRVFYCSMTSLLAVLAGISQRASAERHGASASKASKGDRLIFNRK
jgi:hypothetical protein